MIRPTESHGPLEDRTRKELLALARKIGLKGYSRLRKADLVSRLRDYHEPAESAADRPAGPRIALLARNRDVTGEVGRHVARLAASLGSTGCDVHLFSGAPGEIGAPETTFRHHDLGRAEDGDVMAAAAGLGEAIASALLDDERAGGRFDVVHAHDWTGAEAIRHLDGGRRTILTLHSVESFRCGWERSNLSLAIEARERDAAIRADEVLVLDEDLRAHVIDHYGVPDEKVRVLGEPFPEERFAGTLEDPGEVKARYAVGPVDPLTLYMGPLDTLHGADVLLEAVPAILEAEPRARFVFVGDGALGDALRRRTRELGLEPYVRLVGHREGREVEDLVRASDLVVVPSRGPTSEGPILCAWSAQRPVIVTDEGPSAEVRDDETGLRTRAEPEAVAGGIRRIFEDWEHAQRIGRQGREELRHRHSWEAYAGRVLTAYRPA